MGRVCALVAPGETAISSIQPSSSRMAISEGAPAGAKSRHTPHVLPCMKVIALVCAAPVIGGAAAWESRCARHGSRPSRRQHDEGVGGRTGGVQEAPLPAPSTMDQGDHGVNAPLSFTDFLEKMKDPAAANLVRIIKK